MTSPTATPWYRERRIVVGLAAVLLMGIGLRTAYLNDYVTTSPYLNAPMGEAAQARALGVEVSHGYVTGPEFLPANPLYPLVLGAVYRTVGTSTARVAVLQAALGLLVLGLTFWLGLRLVSAEVGVLSAGLVALYGPLLQFESKLLPVTLAVLLNLAAVLVGTWALSRRRPAWSVLAGLALGLLVWARPWLLIFPVLLGVVALFRLRRASAAARRGGFVRAAFVAVGLLAALTPLLIRNAASGAPGALLPADFGVRVYAGNHPGATGADHRPPGFTGTRRERFAEARHFAAQDRQQPEISPEQVSRHYLGLAARWVADEPGRAATLLLRKAYRFAQQHEPATAYSYGQERLQHQALSWAALPFPALLLLGLVGLWLGGADPHRFLSTNLGAHLAFALLVSVSSEARCTVVPLLAVPASLALFTAARRLPRPAWAVALALAIPAATVLLGWNPLDSAPHLRAAAAERDGQAMERQSRHWAARGRFLEATRADPDRESAQLHLARADLALGRSRDAIARLNRLLNRWPRSTEAHLSLARAARHNAERAAALEDRGTSADWIHQANAHAQQALQLAPDSVDALLLYARLRRSLGKLRESGQLLRKAQGITATRGDLQVELGIDAAIHLQLDQAEARFLFARLLGGRPDPIWVRALEDARRQGALQPPPRP